jgi:hypothetical protein
MASKDGPFSQNILEYLDSLSVCISSSESISGKDRISV